jgi:hypothetical protein
VLQHTPRTRSLSSQQHNHGYASRIKLLLWLPNCAQPAAAAAAALAPELLLIAAAAAASAAASAAAAYAALGLFLYFRFAWEYRNTPNMASAVPAETAKLQQTKKLEIAPEPH